MTDKSKRLQTKKKEKFADVQLWSLMDLQTRWLDWQGLGKKQQQKKELAFWTEQLKTQNARNGMSYRLKGSGIIGKKYPLVDKIIYLNDYLESLELTDEFWCV